MLSDIKASFHSIASEFKGNRFYLYFTIIFITLFVFSLFFGYSFDNATYYQRFALYYYYGFNPFYFLQKGSFYPLIVIAGSFPSMLLALLGIKNIITIEMGIKLPIDFAVYIGGMILYKILTSIGIDEKFSRIGAYIYMLNPEIFWYAFFHGNEMSFTLMFLLIGLYLFQMKKYEMSVIPFAIAGSLYLYPLLFFIPVAYFLLKRLDMVRSMKAVFIYVLTALVGLTGDFLPYYYYHLSPFTAEGSIIAPNSWAAISSTSSVFLPPTFSLYWVPQHFLGFSINLVDYEVIFLILAIVPSFLLMRFFMEKNEDFYAVIVVLLYLGTAFALLSAFSSPQYFQAAMPFVIILSLMQKRVSLIIASAFVSLFQFINGRAPPLLSASSFRMNAIFTNM